MESKLWSVALCVPLAACVLDPKIGGDIVDDGENGATGSSDGGSLDVASTQEDTSDGADSNSESGVVAECSLNSDCRDGSDAQTWAICADGTCGPGTTFSCLPADESTCGNGIVESLEDCDGPGECDACGMEHAGAGNSIPEPMQQLVANPQGGFVSIERQGEVEAMLVHYTDGPFQTAWATNMNDVIQLVRGLAVDAQGNAYALGDDVDTNDPALASWNGDGVLRWVVPMEDFENVGDLEMVGDRIVVGGSTSGGTGQFAVLNTDGALQLLAAEPDANYIFPRAAVDEDLVAVLSNNRIARYDVSSGGKLWEVQHVSALTGLPSEGIADVASDGAGGLWVVGLSDLEMTAYATHYDADGNVLEDIDCFGGRAGWPVSVHVGPDGRVAVGMNVRVGDIGDGAPPLEIWVGVIDRGTVTSGYRPGSLVELGGGGVLAVHWTSATSYDVVWVDQGGTRTNWDVLFSE